MVGWFTAAMETAITIAGSADDVRTRREHLDVTRAQLAVRARTSMTYLAAIEAGCIPARSAVLPRVLAALDELEAEAEKS